MGSGPAENQALSAVAPSPQEATQGRPERRLPATPLVRWIILVLILAVALTLRLVGIGWGLPLQCHADEHRTLEAAARVVSRRTLDPDFYNWPNHVGTYLNAILFPIASELKFGSPLPETYRANLPFFLLVARIAVALLGTLLVWVAFRFGAEYRWEVGILAAVLFAFYPSYVEHSHFVTPDIPLTLFLLLVMLSSLRYLKLGSMRYLIFAAVFAALATGVKYPGMGSVLLIAAVVIARQWRRWRPLFVGLYVSGCVYVASLFLSSPYLVLRFKKVLAAVQHEAKGSHLGAEGLDWLGNAVYYAQSYLGAAGVLLLVFGIIGAVAIVGRERMLALPAFFGLFYWVVLSRHALHWERWALPMYSSGLILGAYGMVFLYEKARQRPTARRLATAAVVAMITVSLASVTLSGVVKTLSATLPETRLVSLRFLEAHSITKENAIYDGATPLSPLSGPSCARELEKLDPRISYIVVSEYMYGRYFKAPTGYEMQKAFYQKVLALPLLAEFRAAPARHRLDVLDVDDVTLQNSTSFELADISEGVSYIVRYLRHRDEMLVGPTIRIHAAPIRPAPQAARE